MDPADRNKIVTYLLLKDVSGVPEPVVSKNKAGYNDVVLSRTKFTINIKVFGSNTNLGTYDTVEKAAKIAARARHNMSHPDFTEENIFTEQLLQEAGGRSASAEEKLVEARLYLIQTQLGDNPENVSVSSNSERFVEALANAINRKPTEASERRRTEAAEAAEAAERQRTEAAERKRTAAQAKLQRIEEAADLKRKKTEAKLEQISDELLRRRFKGTWWSSMRGTGSDIKTQPLWRVEASSNPEENGSVLNQLTAEA